MVIPAAVFAVVPLADSLKYSSLKFCAISIVAMLFACYAGAYLCVRYGLRSWIVGTVNASLLFAAYIFLVNDSLSKKLFCFFNSAMLCEFCSICAIFIAAPYRLLAMLNMTDKFLLIVPSLVYLGMSIPVGLVFWKTLSTKLPVLLNEEHIAPAWQYMFIIPLVMCLLIWWLTPVSSLVVMTGRVRQVGFVLVLFVIITVLMSYHISWWITAKLTDSARIQQENTFLQMETKRYNELREYMNSTKTLRHDFRQHILVIKQFAESGQLPELREYLQQFPDMSGKNYVSRCANSAVDAIASHYDYIARTQGTKINWKLDLPEILAMKESDYCAMLGNLLENSLRAAKCLAVDKRKVNVISSMLSRFMLGPSVDNPFNGVVELGKDGLPAVHREGHGTGLISVKNVVNSYGGTMNITAKNNVFSVDIILYCD